jgi:hypothetical protein
MSDPQVLKRKIMRRKFRETFCCGGNGLDGKSVMSSSASCLNQAWIVYSAEFGDGITRDIFLCLQHLDAWIDSMYTE